MIKGDVTMKKTACIWFTTIFFVLSMFITTNSKATKPDGGQIQTTIEACSKLSAIKIPPKDIGLPTSGATLTSVTFISAKDPGNKYGDYCKVLGAIHPIDKEAPDIHFEVNLPVKWNQKALQMGGGGFNGTASYRLRAIKR